VLTDFQALRRSTALCVLSLSKGALTRSGRRVADYPTLIKRRGRANASITLLGQTAHYIWSTMDIAPVGKTGAGDLAQQAALQLACEERCGAFHTGNSGESDLAGYKKKFAAQPVDHAEIRLERLAHTRIDQRVRSVAKA
jgi:hypothetical protein